MKKLFLLLSCCLAFIVLTSESCEGKQGKDKSRSGVEETTTTVETDLNGKTIEQNNIINRLAEDNKPGRIKHLYVMSAYSGDVLIYSTVKGKVTSSGKRISPTQEARKGDYEETWNPDMIQDDGTYGSSVEYIYWWDSKGIFHQHYPTGGQIIHISNQPLAVKSVTLNLELNTTE